MESRGRIGGNARMKRIFAKGTTQEQLANAAIRMVQGLSPDKTWAIEITEWRKPRTNQQNAFLWGVAYPAVLEGGGEALRGCTNTSSASVSAGKR